MTGTNQKQTDNEISLKEYFDALLQEMDKRYRQQFEASEKALAAALLANKELTAQIAYSNKEALDKAARVFDEYRVVNNEWRGTINDWRTGLLSRTEYDVNHKSLEKQIDELKIFRNEIEGRRDAKKEDKGNYQWVLGAIMGLVGLLGSLFAIVRK